MTRGRRPDHRSGSNAGPSNTGPGNRDPDDDVPTEAASRQDDTEGGAHESNPQTTDRATTGRRRTLAVALGALASTVVAGIVLWPSNEPPPLADIPVDAWAPYWALPESLAELPVRADSIRELSPFWFSATGAGVIVVDPNAPRESTEEFFGLARTSRVPLVASVVDAMPAGGMAKVLADPGTREIHVETLVRFARQGDLAGIDLDYEQFAFADERSTWAETRPNWVTFITELADRLHADGRTLTVSIPPVYDDGRTNESGYWVYDHGAIAQVVDHLRIMAYDYSTSSPGPIAPLDWVWRAIQGTVKATNTREKLVLGIPLYGYNWPIEVAGTCPPGEEIGRTTVTVRSVDELIELRSATPVYSENDGEWSMTYDLVIEGPDGGCAQRRRVHYVDADGARLRMDLARRARLGGVSLWAFGYDDETLWSNIADVIRPPVRP